MNRKRNMVHDKCWQVDLAYQKDGKSILVRDVPMAYHPQCLAAVFHHDFPHTNLDEVCHRFEDIDVSRAKGFAKVLFIDGIRVAIGKACFKAIYDTAQEGRGIHDAHLSKSTRVSDETP